MVAHRGVDRGDAATQFGLVDYVVVDQRRVVKHLKRGAGQKNLTAHCAEHACAQHDKYRTYLLPFDLQITGHYVVHHRVGRAQ